MRSEGYDVAQICLNGHVINSMAATSRSHNKNFCDECGAATITECKHCQSRIKGKYHLPGVVSLCFDFNAPKFCDNCGNMNPWTETQLQVTKELIELAEQLNESEKNELAVNIEELVKESPKVPIAQIKVKKLLSKVDNNISQSIHDALSEIISETIQQNIWK
jgi:hypothetical protein